MQMNVINDAVNQALVVDVEAAAVDAEIKRRLAVAAKIGDDVYAPGQVITFDRVYSGRMYNYAAIKADNNLWYVTGQMLGGRDGAGLPWRRLVSWLLQGDRPVEVIFVVTHSRPLYAASDWLAPTAEHQAV